MSDFPEEIDVSLGTKQAPKAVVAEKPKPVSRARLAESREASTRDKEDRIKYYTNNMHNVKRSVLHIPEEWWPEGYTILWARRSVKGYPDARNIARLESQGWEQVYIDEVPEFFSQIDFAKSDDAELAVVGDMVLMKRLLEIHNVHLASLARERQKQQRLKQAMCSVDKDLHPFAIVGNHDNNDQFFPSDSTSNAFGNVGFG